MSHRIPQILAAASALVLGAAPAASAQSSFQYGVLAGVALADFHGADVGNTSSRTGFVVGGFGRFKASDILAIEPQVIYVQKGAEADAGSGLIGTFKVDYIEVPVLLTAQFPVANDNRIRPSVFAGPAVSFKVHCAINVRNGSNSVEDSCADAGANVKGTDFSAVFGAGLEVRAIGFQLRYDLGLPKIVDTSPQPDIKTQAWIFTVSFRF